MQDDHDELICGLVSGIVRTLVDNDQAVRVELQGDNDSVTLNLHVAISDLGKVIGKQGRTARALRVILSLISSKLQRKYNLNIQG